MLVSPLSIRAFLGATLSVLASVVCAFETKITAPDDYLGRIEGASLVFTAKAEGKEDPRDILAMANADYRRILSVFYDLGHFSPVIQIRVNGQEAAIFPPFAPLTQIDTVNYIVDPGPKFVFGKARVAPLPSNTDLPDAFAKGASANTAAIREAAQAGIEAWRAIGHAKAQIAKQDIRADHRNQRLVADITLDPGIKLSFGNLVLTGDTALREDRLRKIVDLPTGETFDPKALDQITKRLRRTGVFRSVSVTETDTINGDARDIEISVQDNKPRRIGFGAEFESRDGVSLSTYWLHRNLFGGGERLRLEGEISGIGAQTGGTDYRINAELVRPATWGADTDLMIGLTTEQVDDPLFFIETIAARVGFTRLHSERLSSSFGVLLEYNNVSDDFGDRSFQFIGLPLGVTFDGRDDKLDPTVGLYTDVALMPFLGLDDTTSGAHLLADARAYRSFGEKITLAGRVQIGALFGPTLSEAPSDLLFLSGGGGTVRGQPFQSNFITSAGDIESGGRSFLGLSGEVRFRATPTISAVAFYDAGFVGENTDFTNGGEWHAGAGIGARYHTSIGPIRADIGFPVSGENSEGLQLYIGIGQAF